MNLRVGDAAAFFRPTAECGERLAMRGALLDEAPEHYALLDPESEDLIAGTLDFLEPWTERFADLEAVARGVESDWVLLEPGHSGAFRIVAGAVCFPSHWSLPEKAGRTMAGVHGPVPLLNEALGRSIDTFLAKLVVGGFWERENWGLTADPRLDQHPRHELIRLEGTRQLDVVWLRLEQQLFARLSSGGLYFGIAVSHHPLDQIIADNPAVGVGLLRALRTMSEDAARYKGLAAARGNLVALLEDLIR